jgi:hypothetical protein
VSRWKSGRGSLTYRAILRDRLVEIRDQLDEQEATDTLTARQEAGLPYERTIRARLDDCYGLGRIDALERGEGVSASAVELGLPAALGVLRIEPDGRLT